MIRCCHKHVQSELGSAKATSDMRRQASLTDARLQNKCDPVQNEPCSQVLMLLTDEMFPSARFLLRQAATSKPTAHLLRYLRAVQVPRRVHQRVPRGRVRRVPRALRIIQHLRRISTTEHQREFAVACKDCWLGAKLLLWLRLLTCDLQRHSRLLMVRVGALRSCE
jgi:hypothetical protein